MEHQIVQKSFFTQGGVGLARLDPEFSAPTLLKAEEAIREKCKGQNVGLITSSYDGPTVNGSLKSESDIVSYIAIDSIDTSDGLTYSDSIVYRDRPSRAQYLLQAGDILVSTVRPYRGAVTLICKRLAGSLASSGFALLRPQEDPLLTKEYLFAFMRSGLARLQLVRRNRGSMYPAVLDSDVLDIFVPTPSKGLSEKVTKLVRDGLSDHDEFFKSYDAQQVRLEAYLHKTVGNPPPDPLSPIATGISKSIRKYSDFFSAGGPLRFDAEFFRDEYDEFDARITKVPNHFKLGDYYSATTGRAQGNPKQDIPYLKQAILTNAGINWGAVSVEEGDPNPAKGRTKAGDILLACTAHEIFYIGRKVDYVRKVPKEHEDNVCVPDLMILTPRPEKPNELDGAFVAAYLRGPWGLHQVQRCIRGLRGGHVYPDDVEAFVKIPFPPKAWLAEFSADAANAEGRRNAGKEKIVEATVLVTEWLQKCGVSEPTYAVE